jgi:hypothetical protein
METQAWHGLCYSFSVPVIAMRAPVQFQSVALSPKLRRCDEECLVLS